MENSNSLSGRYIIAEDVSMETADMSIMQNIYYTTLEIFAFAIQYKLTPQIAVMEIAEIRIVQRKKEKANL